MLKGFKDFILRGNVIELAVAVVIGGAFTALVTAVVESIINPIIKLVFIPDENGQAGPTFIGIHGEAVTFPLSGLLTAIISFLAVALVVYFVFVMPMNKFKEIQAKRAGIVDEPTPETEQQLLAQIRDLLAKQDAAQSGQRPTAP